MTEESDDRTDPIAIIIHPIPWRSESEWITIYLYRHDLCLQSSMLSSQSLIGAMLPRRRKRETQW